MCIKLSEKELLKLKKLHRKLKNKKDAKNAYKVNAIILLSRGYGHLEVAEMLLLDESTIWRYSQKYIEGGINELLENNYFAYTGNISESDIGALTQELDSKIYMKAKKIRHFIFMRFGYIYSIRGTINLLHRLGYVYKKPVRVPSKADIKKQLEFIDDYEELRRNQGDDEAIEFMDATHPTHNANPAYGWIRKGENRQLKQNTGRKRLDIVGSLDMDAKEVTITLPEENVNSEAVIKHFEKLGKKHKKKRKIHTFVDNAKYFKSKMVREYLENSRIELHYLPSYSPNLNLIERLWRLLKDEVINNEYYETFKEFKTEILEFFKNLKSRFAKEVGTLITENFQIIELST